MQGLGELAAWLMTAVRPAAGESFTAVYVGEAYASARTDDEART